MTCQTCRYADAHASGRIDCANTAAAPRTVTYAGSGAHPLNYDPDIVESCGEWDLADDLYHEPLQLEYAPSTVAA